MPLLTEKLSLINISLQYDTITVYPKNKLALDDMASFIFACKKAGFASEHESLKESAEEYKKFSSQFEKLAYYDRFVLRNDPDHNLYHQDEFKINSVHYHFKCKSQLNEDKLKEILAIATSFCLVSKEEALKVLEDFKIKYQDEVNEVASRITKSKKPIEACITIRSYIKQCYDLEFLSYLHQALLSPEYDFLRRIPAEEHKKNSSPTLFRAIISKEGKLGESSRVWADIEEYFEWQMIHILYTTCYLLPKVGKERAAELHKDNPFFGVKHRCDSEASVSVSEESEGIKLLKKGDVVKLEEEYKKHFQLRV